MTEVWEGGKSYCFPTLCMAVHCLIQNSGHCYFFDNPRFLNFLITPDSFFSGYIENFRNIDYQILNLGLPLAMGGADVGGL